MAAENKINTFAALKARSDPWSEAFDSFGSKHQLLMINNIKSLDDIIALYPKKKQCNIRTYVLGGETVRVLQVLDKYDRVIAQWDNLELIDGKLYVRSQYVPPLSWYGWVFSRFASSRPATVNINVRR